MAALLDAAYTRVDALRVAALAATARLWEQQAGWTDDDLGAFQSSAVPLVEAAQVGAYVLLAAAWLTEARARLDSDVPELPVPASQAATTSALRGVDAATVYARPFVTVRTALSRGTPPTVALQRGATRLASLVDTGMQLATTHAADAALTTAYTGTGFRWYRRLPTGRETCALCLIASTQRYRIGSLLPIHPGCVPAGSPVRAQGVLAVTRRWYAGELAVIATARGDHVTVTPNHPVLTDRGWIPAGLVREGNHLIRRTRLQRAIGGGPDEGHAPALIEDVWRSASVTGRLLQVPLAAEDFHGDGAKREVDVVWTDCNFSPVRDVSFGQHRREERLVPRHHGRLQLDRPGPLAALFEGGFAPAGGGMRGGQLRTPLRVGHPRGPQLASVTPITRFDAPPDEFGPQNASAYASRGLDLVRRLAGEVERDRVVHTSRISWSDHVYNLQTVEGWYESDSHIVSNCDCRVGGPYDTPDPGHVIDPDLLEQTHQLVEQQLGADKVRRSGRGMTDYRDMIVTREHGELGPVITIRGQKHTGPGDLPSERRQPTAGSPPVAAVGEGGRGGMPPMHIDDGDGERPALPGQVVSLDELASRAGVAHLPVRRARVTSVAPTLQELGDRGLLDPAAPLDTIEEDEKRILDWVRANSPHDWRRVGVDRVGPRPDLWCQQLGVTAELKTLASPDPRRWSDRISEAAMQSEHLVLDVRPALAAGMSIRDALRLAVVRIVSHGHAFREVVFVMGDTVDEGLLWIRGQ